MNEETRTPEEVAASLRSGELAAPASDAATAATRRVCLVSNLGNFRLEWSATSPGSYDWIGLYTSSSQPDSNYISGAWQWAVNGSSYDTSITIKPNYEARYLVWYSYLGEYVSVARTGSFPNIAVKSVPAGYPRTPTTAEWNQLLSFFPSLPYSTCYVTAPGTTVYNCIAWSLGFDDRWINPDSPLSAFKTQYQQWGNKAVTTLSSSATIDGWGTSTASCTHGSKTYTGVSVGTSGLWESKLGPYLRITHTRQGLNSTSYGSVIGSFAPGYSVTVSLAEVLPMSVVRVPDDDEVTLLAEKTAAVPANAAAEFETAFDAWKAVWFTGDTFMSSDTRDLARGPEYEKVKSLGPAILPLLVDRLRDSDNFPALVLYDDLQPAKDLVIRYAADDPIQFEGEQARAARTVLQWIAAQR